MRTIIVLLIASSVLFVIVAAASALPMPFASPICPEGQTCDGSYLPWRPIPANHTDKEPTATPQVSVIATPQQTMPDVTVTRRITYRYFAQ